MPQSASVYALFVAAVVAAPPARPQPVDPQVEILTLDRALSLALESNRDLKSAHLEVAKAEDRLAAYKTHRLPVLKWSTLGMQRVTPLYFSFPANAFGPGIPPTDTSIRSPLKPGALVSGRIAQPLSQLYKVGLSLNLLTTDRDIAFEKERARRQSVIADVKSVYYSILQNQSALEAVEQSIVLYRELDRLTGDYVLRQVALKSDNLEAKTRLANAEYEAVKLRDPLETNKEQLNNLMGRDISTPFQVTALQEASLTDSDLDTARKLAVERRPEVHEAALNVRRAEVDRRTKKAEYIPDVSLSFDYFSPVNYGYLIPANIATIGVQLDWEPFDWGRKKHELAEKDRTIDQANLALRDARAHVMIDAGQKFRKLRESRQHVVIRQLGRDTAQERVRVGTNRYKEETMLLKDLLELQTSLADANHEYQKAVLEYWNARAEFEKAIGEE